MRFPESLPWHGRMVVTEDGGVWLERYRPFREDTPTSWAVFGSDGRPRGGIELPAGFSPTQVGDSWVVGVAVDGLGVERVREYELTPP